jgi:hypothetical protein
MSIEQVVGCINSIKLKREKSIVHVICQNNHLHLLRELVATKSNNLVSLAVNKYLDLNLTDTSGSCAMIEALK